MRIPHEFEGPDALMFKMIQRIKNNGNILGPRMDIIVSNASPRATRVT